MKIVVEVIRYAGYHSRYFAESDFIQTFNIAGGANNDRIMTYSDRDAPVHFPIAFQKATVECQQVIGGESDYRRVNNNERVIVLIDNKVNHYQGRASLEYEPLFCFTPLLALY